MHHRNRWIQEKNRCRHRNNCHRRRWNRHLKGWNCLSWRRNQKQRHVIRHPQPKRSWLERIQSKRRWWLCQKIGLIRWSRWSLRTHHWKVLNPRTPWRKDWSRPRWTLQDRFFQPHPRFDANRLHLQPSCLRKSQEQTWGTQNLPPTIHCWRLG
jgi:hypothetical protein